MATHPAPVRLVADFESFVGPLSRMREVAKAVADAMALQQATWEPHDWSDFS